MSPPNSPESLDEPQGRDSGDPIVPIGDLPLGSVLRTRSALFGTATTLVKCVGFLRELLLAKSLGTTNSASALVVAQSFPNLVASAVGDDVSQGAIAPVIGPY